MRSDEWKRLLAGLALTAPVPLVARAEVYMTEDQAAAALFPGVKMEAVWINLAPPEIEAIEKGSGERVPAPNVRVWRGPKGEALFIDRVVGKHEFITYAVAVSTEGKVAGVEIMDYRESFGAEVRGTAWRKQFVGKSAADPVKVDEDIHNISGATISSTHVADGVRRVLKTYEIIKQKP